MYYNYNNPYSVIIIRSYDLQVVNKSSYQFELRL
jgi:hypothetical protein